jgi:large subunit ribosomal protein L31
MKQDIHPKWYPKAKVICACGNTFTVGSTKEEIRVEVCSACHPFYTGQHKFVDTLGRVEKFQAKQKAASEKTLVPKRKRKLLKKIEEAKKEEQRPKTFKEMLAKKA